MEYGSWFFNLFLVFTISMSVSWICFSRLTMARMERQLREEGKPRLCPWDGVGARALWYAWAIAVPVGKANPENDPFIDVPTVRRLATRADWIRAAVFTVSANVFAFLVITGWILDYY